MVPFIQKTRRVKMKIEHLLFAAVALAGVNVDAFAAVSCAPLVVTKIATQPYKGLQDVVTPKVAQLKTSLSAVKDVATYNALLTQSTAIASSIGTSGRVLLTLQDGTVVVDTSKGATNTYANYTAKKINENHNSRVAILDAQLFECGLGLETKISTTDHAREDYVAVRLGDYLNSTGTVRVSKKTATP